MDALQWGGGATRASCAVAYATTAGAVALTAELAHSDRVAWNVLQKRWLVGIDFMRSDPTALDSLSALKRSKVRIANGTEVLSRAGCSPARSYHPKVFAFETSNSIAVVHGSDNLSRTGLRVGHEVGSLLAVAEPQGPVERELDDSLRETINWFDGLWGSADSYSSLAPKYRALCEANLSRRPPIDDDAGTTERLGLGGPRRSDPARLRQLRAADNLWIETGNLHENRGRGNPGDQLMMSPMTRVFFDFPASDLPTNSAVGYVTIRYRSNEKCDCSLRFSDNSMDVLTLPVPEPPWPTAYDQEVLCFRRKIDARGVVYEMQVASASDRSAWRSASSRKGSEYAMTSGRRWGVF